MKQSTPYYLLVNDATKKLDDGLNSKATGIGSKCPTVQLSLKGDPNFMKDSTGATPKDGIYGSRVFGAPAVCSLQSKIEDGKKSDSITIYLKTSDELRIFFDKLHLKTIECIKSIIDEVINNDGVGTTKSKLIISDTRVDLLEQKKTDPNLCRPWYIMFGNLKLMNSYKEYFAKYEKIYKPEFAEMHTFPYTEAARYHQLKNMTDPKTQVQEAEFAKLVLRESEFEKYSDSQITDYAAFIEFEKTKDPRFDLFMEKNMRDIDSAIELLTLEKNLEILSSGDEKNPEFGILKSTTSIKEIKHAISKYPKDLGKLILLKAKLYPTPPQAFPKMFTKLNIADIDDDMRIRPTVFQQCPIADTTSFITPKKEFVKGVQAESPNWFRLYQIDFVIPGIIAARSSAYCITPRPIVAKSLNLVMLQNKAETHVKKEMDVRAFFEKRNKSSYKMPAMQTHSAEINDDY